MPRTNTMTLGSVPLNEGCAQVGTPDYGVRAYIESRVYVQQLLRAFFVAHGRPPLGVQLVVRDNPHDHGVYHDVAMVFGDEDEQATADAIWFELNIPEVWDDVAVGKLRDQGLVIEPPRY